MRGSLILVLLLVVLALSGCVEDPSGLDNSPSNGSGAPPLDEAEEWLNEFASLNIDRMETAASDITDAGEAIESGRYHSAERSFEDMGAIAWGSLYLLEEDHAPPPENFSDGWPTYFSDGWKKSMVFWNTTDNLADVGVECMQDAQERDEWTPACEEMENLTADFALAADDLVLWLENWDCIPWPCY